MYGNLPQQIMFDENNSAQVADRREEPEMASRRNQLAQTLKTPPSTGKTAGSRKLGSTAAFASNANGIPKRPHSGANPRQPRENSNGPPAPSAK